MRTSTRTWYHRRRKFGDIVVARHFNLIAMFFDQPAKLIEAGLSPLIVIGSLSSECRDGVILFRHFGPQVIRVANVK